MEMLISANENIDKMMYILLHLFISRVQMCRLPNEQSQFNVLYTVHQILE